MDIGTAWYSSALWQEYEIEQTGDNSLELVNNSVDNIRVKLVPIDETAIHGTPDANPTFLVGDNGVITFCLSPAEFE